MAVDELNWVGRSLAGGRYRVTALLGEGGMGSVYRAQDANLDAEVVIKVPRAGLVADKEFAARFAREVRSLVKLAHAHVVRVLDVGEQDGLPFAVMQFLPGGSLRDRAAAWPDPRAALAALGSWLPDVAAALDYVHGQGYVHRDVKPDNILFDGQGDAYLGDFGIVKALATQGGAQEGTFHTSAGLVVGTPQYMAPELIMGHAFDGRVDQYALAVTAYEVVCGRVPFEGSTSAALVVQHATKPPPPPHEAAAGVSPAFSAALLRGLAKDPAQRYSDCRALAQALLAVAAEARPAAVPAGPPASRATPPPLLSPPLPTPGPAPAAQEYPCPSCGTVFQLPPHPEGKRLRCRFCGADFTIPSTLPGAAPAAETDAIRAGRMPTPRAMPAAPAEVRPIDRPPPVPPPVPAGASGPQRVIKPPPPAAPPPLPAARMPCPSCGKMFAVPERMWGKRVRCSGCKTQFTLPPPPPPPVPGPAEVGPKPARSRGFARSLLAALALGALVLVALAAGGLGLWYYLSPPIGEELKYMPDNCSGIASLRIDQLTASDAYEQFKRQAPKAVSFVTDMENDLGLPASAVERVTVGFQPPGKAELPVQVVRTRQPVSVGDLLAKIKRDNLFKEVKVGAHTLHASETNALCVADKKLVLYGSPGGLRAVLERGKKPTLPDRLQAAMKQTDYSRTIALALSLEGSRGTPGVLPLGGSNANFNDVFEQAQGLALQVKVGSDVTVQVTVLCKDAKSASDVKKILDATLVMLRKDKNLSKEVADLYDITFSVSGSNVTGGTTSKVGPLAELFKDTGGKDGAKK